MSSNKSAEVVKVWDVPTRLFYWALVLSFTLAYFTAEFHIGFIHALIGYFLCGLLIARLVWGFIGSKYARFSSFVFSVEETLAYLRSIRQKQAIHYLGHNPAGALIVFTVLAVLLLILFSGLLTLAAIDFEGPLLFMTGSFADVSSYLMYDMHGWLIDIALILIPLHLLGVAVGSIQHKENLV